MDWLTHEKHEIKCQMKKKEEKNDFTVISVVDVT